MDLDLEKNATTRQGTYVCLGICVQVLCLVFFVLGSLWGTAAVLEFTHLLGVQGIPGGVAHVRLG